MLDPRPLPPHLHAHTATSSTHPASDQPMLQAEAKAPEAPPPAPTPSGAPSSTRFHFQVCEQGCRGMAAKAASCRIMPQLCRNERWGGHPTAALAQRPDACCTACPHRRRCLRWASRAWRGAATSSWWSARWAAMCWTSPSAWGGGAYIGQLPQYLSRSQLVCALPSSGGGETPSGGGGGEAPSAAIASAAASLSPLPSPDPTAAGPAASVAAATVGASSSGPAVPASPAAASPPPALHSSPTCWACRGPCSWRAAATTTGAAT